MITALGLQWLQFVPCFQTDGRTEGRQTSTDDKSLAELKALSCAKTMSVLDVEMKIFEKIPETHVIQ